MSRSSQIATERSSLRFVTSVISELLMILMLPPASDQLGGLQPDVLDGSAVIIDHDDITDFEGVIKDDEEAGDDVADERLAA
jgi:hypothetical protein